MRTAFKDNTQRFYCDGLNHPRSLAGDFPLVEKAFKEAISRQPSIYWGLIKPSVLVHLVPEAEGGYTMLESKFFQEAAIGGGARKICLVDDSIAPLQDSELSETFKTRSK